MDEKKLRSIIKKEEGTKLDFKLKLDLWSEGGKKEFAKDICAIANSRGAGRGYIIVGVRDKTKEIVGLKDEDMFREEAVQQIIATRCEPPIPINVEFTILDNKKIAIITIYNGDQRPYQVRENGAFYTRRGSTTDVMRKQEILRIFEENLELSVETCPVLKSDISYLDMSLVKKYFFRKGIVLNDKNRKYLLESSGITYIQKETGKEKCTLGGLLVFSEINSICISNNIIRIINKLNNNYDEVIVIQGSLLTMINKTDDLLRKIINKEYPIFAVLEAVKNAVLYREYTEVNRIIEIVITNKSIVIESPGELISNNTNTNYIRRNMWIYEKLITLDDTNTFLNNGRGLSRIKNAFKGKGRVRFVNSETDNTFKVILPGKY